MSARRGHGEGSIHKRADGRWAAVIDLGWQDGNRQRKYVYGRTRAEVATRLRGLQTQVTAGLPPEDGRLTVGQLLEQWIRDVVPNTVGSPNTVDNYRWAVDRHLVPAIGKKRLRSLTPEDVESLLKAKAATGMSHSSLMRLRAVLGQALRWAERRGKVARNVVSLVDTPNGLEKQGRSLTVEQASKLLGAARGDRLEALCIAGLMVGLRPGELLGLAWEDVDLDAALLEVRQSLKRERTGLRIGAPKTAGSRRTLDLPQPVVEALRSHRSRQAAERLAAGPHWQDSGLVFTSLIGMPLDPSNLRRYFSALTTRAGLGHWHPHELRHSTASILSASGVRLEAIADVLGHKGTRMTAQVYRHAVTPSVAAAVAPMERLFGRETKEDAS